MALATAKRESRARERIRRRISMQYGPHSDRHQGYTSDLGEKGLFLQGGMGIELLGE